MADTPQAFATALLHRLGIKPNSNNVRALVGWQKAEGGHWNNDAKFNPLNTTQPEPGAGNTGTQGNIKVYRSWHQGIEATAKTLTNGKYSGILHALRSGGANDVASAIGNSPWGTSASSVAKIIGSTGKVPLGGTLSGGGSTPSSGGVQPADSGTHSVTSTNIDPKIVLANMLAKSNPNNLLLRTGALTTGDPNVRSTTEVPNSPPASVVRGGKTSAVDKNMIGGSKSPLLELIHNDGSTGYAVKNGQVVSGPGVYGSVWAGHRDHVHVAAGKDTIVRLGKLAQSMGLHVGENPNFGGVTDVHVSGSYHYKGEAIDVSGSPKLMNRYAARVESIYGLT
jgi:hypothetical protein